MDAAVLHRLDGVGDHYRLARDDFWIGNGAGFDEFHDFQLAALCSHRRVDLIYSAPGNTTLMSVIWWKLNLQVLARDNRQHQRKKPRSSIGRIPRILSRHG